MRHDINIDATSFLHNGLTDFNEIAFLFKIASSKYFKMVKVNWHSW